MRRRSALHGSIETFSETGNRRGGGHFLGQAADAREPSDDMSIGYLIEPDSIEDGDT